MWYLKYRLANSGPWTKSGLLPVFFMLHQIRIVYIFLNGWKKKIKKTRKNM